MGWHAPKAKESSQRSEESAARDWFSVQQANGELADTAPDRLGNEYVGRVMAQGTAVLHRFRRDLALCSGFACF